MCPKLKCLQEDLSSSDKQMALLFSPSLGMGPLRVCCLRGKREIIGKGSAMAGMEGEEPFMAEMERLEQKEPHRTLVLWPWPVGIST